MTAAPTPAAPTPTGPSAPPRPRGAGLLHPARLLRLEGLALLGTALVLYAHLDAGWWLFAALFLAPDVGLLGYLAGPRWGARAYNLTHTLALPAVVGAAGLVTGVAGPVAVALVWAAHIGADRALGYGLKYPGAFADTHLQRLA